MFIVQLVLFESFSPFLEISPLLKHRYFQRHSERRNERGASEPCFGDSALFLDFWWKLGRLFASFDSLSGSAMSQTCCECFPPRNFKEFASRESQPNGWHNCT